MQIKSAQKGYLLMLVLVFGAVFATIAAGFLSFVVSQYRYQSFNYNRERALDIAEAGLDYYKWFLAHNPSDMTNGTGAPGPYVGVYYDPEGSAIGEYSLNISSSTACGEVYAVDIHSTGHTYAEPNVGRQIYARYARPTVAKYAYIINSNVWAGSDRIIIGPYYSNGGIRMDGTNKSTVSSGQSSWSCTASFGCTPTATKDGVFGAGVNQAFWSFPSPPINFTGLSVDLSAMQSKAKNNGGIYIPPSGKSGYHVVFQSDGTINVYVVDTTTSYWGYTTENGWQIENNVIKTEHFLASYAVPSSCSVIFVEDKIWLEGTIKGKVTIAAADVDTPGVDPSMILNDNITYANATSGLLAIAESDVLIGLKVPNDMTLNGIFVAQNGRFGINYYCTTNCDPSHSGSEAVPLSLTSYVKRNSLTVNGTIVSNGREGTKWTNGGGAFLSGFDYRYNSYDRALVSDPPPLTPNVSDSYEFVEWRDLNN